MDYLTQTMLNNDDINLEKIEVTPQYMAKLFLYNLAKYKYLLLSPEEDTPNSMTIAAKSMLINAKILTLKKLVSLATNKNQAISIKQLLEYKKLKKLNDLYKHFRIFTLNSLKVCRYSTKALKMLYAMLTHFCVLYYIL